MINTEFLNQANNASPLWNSAMVQETLDRMQQLKNQITENETELKALVVELSEVLRVDHELDHADAVYWGKLF